MHTPHSFFLLVNKEEKTSFVAMFQCFQKRIVFLLIFSVPFCGLLSQRVSFLFLQSEEKTPFYVKRDKQIYSSTATGYLLLSKLPENDLTFQLGFPGSNRPESVFRVSLSKGEKGYLIKSFGEKGFGLFDLQDATVIYAISTSATEKKEEVQAVVAPADDGFVNLLSGVTGDSTVKYVTYVKKEPAPIPIPEKKDSLIKQQPVMPEVKKEVNLPEIQRPERRDSLASKQPDIPKPDMKAPPKEAIVESSKTTPKSVISILKKSESSEGISVIYSVSTSPSKTDTVDVEIIHESKNRKEEAKKATDVKVPSSDIPAVKETIAITSQPPIDSVVKTSPSPTVSDAEKKNELMVVDSVSNTSSNPNAFTGDSLNNKTSTTEPILNTPVIQPVNDKFQNKDSLVQIVPQESKPLQVLDSSTVNKSPVIPNTTCRKSATEEDFIKLRRKMAQQSKDEEMLSEAEKFFRNVCFTTQQIRGLGSLFVKEEWRYRFYDAAMKYVLDFENFSKLENTLETPYYKKRFLALIPQ